MADRTPVAIPRETVNDDFVTIVKWYVKAGEAVKKGDALLDFETSKAVVTLEAEQDGYIDILLTQGEKATIGQEVGYLLPQAAAAKPEAKAEAETSSSAQQISAKARKLIDDNGIDVAAFEGLSFVREADVVRFMESGVSPASQPKDTISASKGVREAARDRGWSVPRLMLNYFFKNYLLGRLVRVLPRPFQICLHRLRGVKIGKGCFIDPTAIVETAYAEYIEIGDDVYITAQAVIMCHIKAPYYLRSHGYVPRVISKVVLENHCFIGVNSVIMPGVTVGKGSVVASGAVVFHSVPPHVMVSGNPAKVVRQFSVPDDKEEAC